MVATTCPQVMHWIPWVDPAAGRTGYTAVTRVPAWQRLWQRGRERQRFGAYPGNVETRAAGASARVERVEPAQRTPDLGRAHLAGAA
jgi:hypothetical protein